MSAFPSTTPLPAAQAHPPHAPAAPAAPRPEAPASATADDPGFVPPVITHAANVLTERERKIVQLLGYGRSIKYIAKRLKCAPQTVETHKGNVYRKLDIHNRVELTRWAIVNKICKLTA